MRIAGAAHQNVRSYILIKHKTDVENVGLVPGVGKFAMSISGKSVGNLADCLGLRLFGEDRGALTA